MKTKVKPSIRILLPMAVAVSLLLSNQLTAAQPPAPIRPAAGSSADARANRPLPQSMGSPAGSAKERLNPQNLFDTKPEASSPNAPKVRKDLMNFEGNSNGGGGHLCKAMVQRYYQSMRKVFATSRSLSEKYPIWKSIKDIMDPNENPAFEIKIVEQPIQGCRNTQNALACAHPLDNSLELYCGEVGLNSVVAEERYKHLLHEMLWWQKEVNDANYFYSTPMAKDVYNEIQRTIYGERNEILFAGGEMAINCSPIQNGQDQIKFSILPVFGEDRITPMIVVSDPRGVVMAIQLQTDIKEMSLKVLEMPSLGGKLTLEMKDEDNAVLKVDNFMAISGQADCKVFSVKIH
jgi:hypothetical protein